MKIVNYKYGYIPLFSCSINGKITMTVKEFEKVKKYLFNPAVKSYYLDKTILKEDLDRRLHLCERFWVNIRVSATEKIVNRFKLQKYKRNNYVLEVV